MIWFIKRLFHSHRVVPGTDYWDDERQAHTAGCRCGAELCERRLWEEWE
jgi:hypothetical protein